MRLMEADASLRPPSEMARSISGVRVTIDVPQGMFRVTDNGDVRVSTVIEDVSQEDGVFTLHREDASSEGYRVLPDGRLEGVEDGRPVFVLRRAN